MEKWVKPQAKLAIIFCSNSSLVRIEPKTFHLEEILSFLCQVKQRSRRTKKKLGKLHFTPSGLGSISIPYNIFKIFHFHISRTILFQYNTSVTFSIH